MNLQAEYGLVGQLLITNSALDQIPFLQADHFADAANAEIFAAISRRVNAGGLIDLITLRAEFEARGMLEEIGGASHLASLLVACCGRPAVQAYAHAIHEAWQRRRLIEVGTALVDASFGGDEQPADLAARLAGDVDLVAASATRGDAVSFDDALTAALAAAERAMMGGGGGISTGFRSIDDALGGLEPGTMTVLAGRPGMGKTALGLGIALNVARAAREDRAGGVAVVSLEMTATQLATRALASAANIPVHVIKRGDLNVSSADYLVAARRELTGLPLSIDDVGGQTIAHIRLRLRQARRKLGGRLSLILLDHLHIVRPEADDAKHGGAWAVGRISNSLKAMAKEFECPVLVMAQLSRGPEGREDKRPTLADLRQSGDIEQDADAVGFLYRAEYYLPKGEIDQLPNEADEKYRARCLRLEEDREKLRGKAELILEKVRDGEPCAVPLRWRAATTQFTEMDSNE